MSDNGIVRWLRARVETNGHIDGELEEAAADYIEYLEAALAEERALVDVLGTALTAVAHDRPSAHSDGVWLLIQQALEALAAAPSSLREREET